MKEEVFKELQNGLDKALSSFQRELAKVRTGRANPAILDGIRVDYYGTPTPLNQLATISIPESRLIVIAPWDVKVCYEVEKAIQKSELSLNPINDGKVVRISFPQLTEERRKELVKVVKKMAEDAKIVVRKERRDANEKLKKLEENKSLTKDDHHKSLDKVQKMHDDFIGKIDAILEKKEKEILEV